MNKNHKFPEQKLLSVAPLMYWITCFYLRVHNVINIGILICMWVTALFRVLSTEPIYSYYYTFSVAIKKESDLSD